MTDRRRVGIEGEKSVYSKEREAKDRNYSAAP